MDEREKALIERVKQEPEQFGELFDMYFDQLFRYVRSRVRDEAIAEDVLSDTFYKAYTKIHQFQFRGVPFSAWLYRIATNEVNLHFRRNKKLASLDDMETHEQDMLMQGDVRDEIHDDEDERERGALAVTARELLSDLPDKYHEVLYLRFAEELQVKEVAERLGKKEGTVKSLIHRGLKQLKDLMEAQRSAVTDITHI